MNNKSLEENLIDIMKKCITSVMHNKDKRFQIKEDGTKLTIADIKLHNIIKKSLLTIYPEIPLISEEGEFKEEDFQKKIYWLIDPLDGTSNYASGGNFFTVNVALIKEGNPIVGIIAHPPSNTIWFGNGELAYKKTVLKKTMLSTHSDTTSPKIIVSSHLDPETDLFIKKIKSVKIINYSSSIKFCKIAEGVGDLYPRLTSIKKWDIAAGDAILRSSGGMLLNSKKKNYVYNTATSESGIFFAVSSRTKWIKILKKYS